jgi:hypothetical protein
MMQKMPAGIAFGPRAHCRGARFLFRSARSSITHLQGEHSLSLPSVKATLKITENFPLFIFLFGMVVFCNYAFGAE